MLSEEQWEKVEWEPRTVLLIDGYKVTIRLERNKMRFYYFIYVNGDLKFYLEDYEERRRFCQRHQHFMFSGKNREKVTKTQIKKWHLDKKIDHYTPYWSSFAPLKRHLIKNNKSIELVE